jgi:hypothetical protein
MSDKTIRFGYFIILGFSLAVFWGCGSSSFVDSVVDSNSMSSVQASNFATSLSRAATSSMGNSAFKEPAYSDSLFPAEIQQSDGLPKSLGLLINQSISATRTCQSGGRIAVTGSITGGLNDNTGTGVILIDARETITDWSCLSPLIINGDPYISLTGTFSFINFQPATQQHIGITGGIKWGTSSAQSCQVSLDTNFNRDGTGRTTGSVCGHSIDITF